MRRKMQRIEREEGQGEICYLIEIQGILPVGSLARPLPESMQLLCAVRTKVIYLLGSWSGVSRRDAD